VPKPPRPVPTDAAQNKSAAEAAVEGGEPTANAEAPSGSSVVAEAKAGSEKPASSEVSAVSPQSQNDPAISAAQELAVRTEVEVSASGEAEETKDSTSSNPSTAV
jgi:hypothetical protein